MSEVEIEFEKQGYIRKEVNEYLFYMNPETKYTLEFNLENHTMRVLYQGQDTQCLTKSICNLLAIKARELGWIE